MGTQLNAAVDEWRRDVFNLIPDAAIRETMQRPNPTEGRHIGKYVALAAVNDYIVSIFAAEFDMRTLKLSITARAIDPTRPEDLPEPFRTLATHQGTGFVLAPSAGGPR